MNGLVHAFDFLDEKDIGTLPQFCVVFGDENFLKQLAMRRVRDHVLGAEADELPYATLDGSSCQWRDLIDELTTVSLFGGSTRLVTVDEADDFVKNHRTQLEELAAEPAGKGVLLLCVNAWPGNTRLAKKVAKTGFAIECRPPQRMRGRYASLDEGRLTKWIVSWGKTRHDLRLDESAAREMLQLVGPHLGLMDQELAKLALYADQDGKVSAQLVVDTVGGWRTKTTWDLLDAATFGDAAEALRQLHRLLRAGENALAMFGAFSWSLRRFAAATRVIQNAERNGQRPNLRNALVEAGFRQFPKELEKAERQLRQLGRIRAGQLYRWLLEADLMLKRSHSTPERARYVLEHLILRISRRLQQTPVVAGN